MSGEKLFIACLENRDFHCTCDDAAVQLASRHTGGNSGSVRKRAASDVADRGTYRSI